MVKTVRVTLLISLLLSGVGDKEEVIIKASCSDDLFVNIHNSTVTIENLSFWQVNVQAFVVYTYCAIQKGTWVARHYQLLR